MNMMQQRLHPKLARAIALVEHHLAAGGQTKNELYSWWSALGNEPADLRDALDRLAEDGRIVDSKLGATKLLRLASSKPEPLPPPEPPRTWMPGVKSRAASAVSRPVPPSPAVAPADEAPSVPPEKSGVEWITTDQAAHLLGVSGVRVKQLGDDGRLSWRPREGTKRNRDYSRSSVEALVEKRARGEMARPAAIPAPPQVSSDLRCRMPTREQIESAAELEPSAVAAEPALEPEVPPAPPPAPAAALTRFALAIPERLHDYLEQLRRIGLYGDTVEAVAERLICESLLRRIDKPVLKLRGAA